MIIKFGINMCVLLSQHGVCNNILPYPKKLIKLTRVILHKFSSYHFLNKGSKLLLMKLGCKTMDNCHNCMICEMYVHTLTPTHNTRNHQHHHHHSSTPFTPLTSTRKHDHIHLLSPLPPLLTKIFLQQWWRTDFGTIFWPSKVIP